MLTPTNTHLTDLHGPPLTTANTNPASAHIVGIILGQLNSVTLFDSWVVDHLTGKNNKLINLPHESHQLSLLRSLVL